MKIGLLSDVHGNHAALRAALGALGGVDGFFFVGDLTGYYPFVNECLELWPAKPVWCVRGNHDQVLLDCAAAAAQPPAAYTAAYGPGLARALNALPAAGREFLAGWPRSTTVTLEGVTILLVHGAPWNALEGRVYPDFAEWERFDGLEADIVAMGHTHYAMTHRAGGRLLVNPGSVGQARDRSGLAQCAILNLPERTVERLRVPYDPGVVVDDARRHAAGFPYLVKVLNS